MNGMGQELGGRGAGSLSFAKAGKLILGMAMVMPGLAGCISVNAPDKPIVIELNINIKQEVIYRLAEDASNTIESRPDIF